MVPTRRRLLGVVGLLAVGAGCGSTDTETATVGEDDTPAGPDAGQLTDPPTLVVRGEPDDDRPPITLSEGGEPAEFDRRRGTVDSEVVADRETAATVATTAAADDDAVRSFLDATDFDSESVYVQTLQVLACYDVTLCSIGWSTGSVNTEYGRRLKPYTEACPADTRVFETRLIRLPGRIGRVSSLSTSLSGGSCRGSRRDGDGERDATDEERDATDGESDSDTDTATTAESTTEGA
ncbi:hypothetical protein [Halobaculum sp. MBLA0143]|uniref:hypothetical protein n=1 Tax=Halobaculum sp. MBLA0143 TaxID=3079933 RepID=UPI0035249C6B